MTNQIRKILLLAANPKGSSQLRLDQEVREIKEGLKRSRHRVPENASTYVKREADDELYEALLQNKFCYVLNSRQSGKSSLRVRTMSRLGEASVECASIDLSSISIQSATQENWYADLIVKLIDSYAFNHSARY